MDHLSSRLIRGLAMLTAIVLAGCSVQGAAPGPDVVLPPMAAGGGIISSDQGAASAPDTPPEPEPPKNPDSQEEAPSFQELPSSQTPPPPPESPSSVASSLPPSSSSSQPLPPSSVASKPPVSEEPEEEELEEDDEDDEDEDEEEDEEEDKPVHVRPSRPSSSSSSSSVPPAEPEADDNTEDNGSSDDGSASGWQDLRVQYNGSVVSGSGVSIVARIVQNEIRDTYPDEAIKAQAVAAYTFVRYHNTTGAGSAPAVGLANASEKVTRLVREVAGEEITYGGKPILASYCAMSAGQTASSRSVWGRDLPYLTPVDSSEDEEESGFLRTTEFSSSQVKSKLQSALGVNLDGIAPESWFEILSWWDDGPYVNEVRIGGTVTTTGRKLRENVFGLRSAAFEVAYDAGTDRFTFTTRGYGHGVGMSQVGAKRLASAGWNHIEILEHYYSGAEVG